jgi:glycosyltransferase involved in cell wall biosynthesis
MSAKATVVIFFNDWKVFPRGVNAGGGESATVALAKEIVALGYRVIACANLPEGETIHNGIEYWNFGNGYNIHTLEKRLRDIGPYHALAATLVHPFLLLREHRHCLSRVVINHAPSPHASGLEPATALELVDCMICVSHAQRSLILKPSIESEKLQVVRNGFDPELFRYSGPEGRDWNQLVFIGRHEFAKGIHVLLQVFAELKRDFPDLKLALFGDESYWPDMVARKGELMRDMPGLTFNGKVPQRELAAWLQKAGLLVFPSVSFETAGLVVVDAQASGCPVVAYAVGGVPEYVHDGLLGKVVYDKTPEALRVAIAELLRNRSAMIEMSRAAKDIGRTRTWHVVAQEVMACVERVASRKNTPSIARIPAAVERIRNADPRALNEVLDLHQALAQTEVYSDVDLERALLEYEKESWPHFIRALRHEQAGLVDQAIQSYQRAIARSQGDDWQAHLRLALVCAEKSDFPLAATYAQEVLKRAPAIPVRNELERLVALSQGI